MWKNICWICQWCVQSHQQLIFYFSFCTVIVLLCLTSKFLSWISSFFNSSLFVRLCDQPSFFVSLSLSFTFFLSFSFSRCLILLSWGLNTRSCRVQNWSSAHTFLITVWRLQLQGINLWWFGVQNDDWMFVSAHCEPSHSFLKRSPCAGRWKKSLRVSNNWKMILAKNCRLFGATTVFLPKLWHWKISCSPLIWFLSVLHFGSTCPKLPPTINNSAFG